MLMGWLKLWPIDFSTQPPNLCLLGLLTKRSSKFVCLTPFNPSSWTVTGKYLIAKTPDVKHKSLSIIITDGCQVIDYHWPQMEASTCTLGWDAWSLWQGWILTLGTEIGGGGSLPNVQQLFLLMTTTTLQGKNLLLPSTTNPLDYRFLLSLNLLFKETKIHRRNRGKYAATILYIDRVVECAVYKLMMLMSDFQFLCIFPPIFLFAFSSIVDSYKCLASILTVTARAKIILW